MAKSRSGSQDIDREPQSTPPQTPSALDAQTNIRAFMRRNESDEERQAREAREAAAPVQPDPSSMPHAVREGDVLDGGLVVVAVKDMHVQVQCPDGMQLENGRLVSKAPGPFQDVPVRGVLTMAQAESLKARTR